MPNIPPACHHRRNRIIDRRTGYIHQTGSIHSTLRGSPITHLLFTEIDEKLAELLRNGRVVPVTGAREKIEPSDAEFFDSRNRVQKSISPLAGCRVTNDRLQN